jgi:NAD(P)-dependent dehydrogenase (short-subunit alcohol dehydrogenase family)
LKKLVTVIIIGGGSTISRNSFKNCQEYNIIGFSKHTSISRIKEYKTYKYSSANDIYKIISKINTKKIVLLLMESLSIPNLIINKNETELKKEIFSNIINPHNIIKKILPLMLKNKWGRIIFCGSSGALKTDAGISGYSLGKYANLAYCKVLSKEYAKFGISSNYLSLGLFDTPMFKKKKTLIKKKLLEQTDTRSTGDFSSFFYAIDFIIKSNYVTGSVIPVDGGFN